MYAVLLWFFRFRPALRITAPAPEVNDRAALETANQQWPTTLDESQLVGPGLRPWNGEELPGPPQMVIVENPNSIVDGKEVPNYSLAKLLNTPGLFQTTLPVPNAASPSSEPPPSSLVIPPGASSGVSDSIPGPSTSSNDISNHPWTSFANAPAALYVDPLNGPSLSSRPFETALPSPFTALRDSQDTLQVAGTSNMYIPTSSLTPQLQSSLQSPTPSRSPVVTDLPESNRQTEIRQPDSVPFPNVPNNSTEK
eukprot:CAMPEP_0184645758 /NCGR_PEP_ID=MMETSP0308-20130426/2339_1 /TAXON_ID=38269 /ORGANISM="Gloeochaete witrockiana, Strain SAG 46.84" /LENGTH=252 /DNA_ID=CAMNT_0027075129 /DNA_START=753 /DNA_END=1511 /DNA_ORIENTATION=+